MAGQIFFDKLGDSHAHFVHVRLGFRLDGDGDDRLGNEHILQRDRMVFVAKRVSGLYFLKSDGSRDITGFDKVDRVLLVGEHFQDAADPLLLPTANIQYVGTGIQVTAVTAEECQPAHERIGHDLEGQRGERLLWTGFADDRFPRVA